MDVLYLDEEGNIFDEDDPSVQVIEALVWEYEVIESNVTFMFTFEVSYKETLTFGSTFEFRDFQIEIGSEDDIVWLTVENQFADKDGAEVFGILVKLTNFSNETGRLNTFSYKFFGPEDTEIDSLSSYFRDYDIWSQGDMRPEVSQEGYFTMEYVGDGEYVIEFSESVGTTEVTLHVES